MFRYLIGAALAALLLTTAQAETGDREKPLEITADTFHGDEVTQLAIYTGNVEVHQGTMEILGDKLTLRVLPSGYRVITVEGKPVKMKQRSDPKTPKVDEWMHATSLQAVYDESKDTVTLLDNAKLDRSENGLIKDSAQGMKIVYNLRTARSYVEGGVVEGRKARVTTILSPRNKDTMQAPAQPQSAPLTSTTQMK